MLLLLLAGAPSGISSVSAQQARPAPARSDNRLSTLDGFTVDYPKKDWQVLVGTGSSLVVFFHKSREATVAIERTRVRNALAPNEIVDQTATIEIEDWTVRRPLSTGYKYRFLEMLGTRVIVLDFTQPGPQGDEQVRMYAVPQGSDWYRVICTAKRDAFAKFGDTCHRIAMSLYPAPSQ
jgi:hypothetical protein